MRFLIFAALLGLSGAVGAQVKQPTIEQIRTQESFDHVFDLLDSYETTLGTLDRARRTACQRAFGHVEFCGCLNDRLPVVWNFAQYVAITTGSKEENGFDTLEADLKIAYDMVEPVREECVKEMHQ